MNHCTFDRTDDRKWMARAIKLAEKGRYTTQPNPRVGCVIIAGNQLVGEGYHQLAGGHHAEIHALQQAADQARGATAYVSLEPCSHQGKTPPCADALIAAGVSRVVCAMQDPNPQVSGQGLKKLEQAGISTDSGLLQGEAEALNPGFIKRMKTGLPYVRVKLAMSLDGRTAMASGESQWITGEAARADVQALRARSSVVLTGSATVLADNPSMNVRISAADLCLVSSVAELVPHQPLRAIIDSELKVPAESKIFHISAQQAGQKPYEPVIVFSHKNARVKDIQSAALNAAQVVNLSDERVDGSEKINLSAAMKWLAEHKQANEVHVEAGSVLCGALLERQLVDEMIIYMAPHIMGDGAKGLFHLPNLKNMSERINLEIKEIRPIGKDWRITAVPVYQA
ncbi:Diaminohydroxyphosphoribosylaminopyrimidine deaminase / 5-amino-6-(5-phosphoribosylamino)uracil reductase [hydrothermal vent metagenome]|uniref:Diaminohydroxyphosphoribosylaminopyrimidine deaminase / 5-amino-6-(5-phosphoribosylamino)uracil reductase n=1 Tax=hydrothermal vent metagenome TaxID=652676 RepID=A0A3B0XET7_9ZZZZ